MLFFRISAKRFIFSFSIFLFVFLSFFKFTSALDHSPSSTPFSDYCNTTTCEAISGVAEFGLATYQYNHNAGFYYSPIENDTFKDIDLYVSKVGNPIDGLYLEIWDQDTNTVIATSENVVDASTLIAPTFGQYPENLNDIESLKTTFHFTNNVNLTNTTNAGYTLKLKRTGADSNPDHYRLFGTTIDLPNDPASGLGITQGGRGNDALGATLVTVYMNAVMKTTGGEVEPSCLTACYSNVLFFPGIMGSRLYRQADEEKEVWFSRSADEHKNLALDQYGKDTQNLYTKNDTVYDGNSETGIIDEIFVLNIYKSFISDLRDWKDEGVMNDYAFIPYDWRLSLDDIITNGHVDETGRLSYKNTQDFSESFILQKLQELQETSKSGKVTIIAHSNGGLVTKALMQKLKDTNNPLYDKIDKIIFVAVPQVGTPEAIVSLLHGRSLAKGFVMKAKTQRYIAENMPTTYNLLPSAGYFSTVRMQAPFLENLITFPNGAIFNPQIIQYGEDITDETELKAYLLGSDAREKPQYNDTNHPNIGNGYVYDQAQAVHSILDNWQPPTNTKVIEVGGWGEETIAGLDYKVKHGEISFKPRMVVDGDATVVLPSALWMPESANVERWWVDLDKYNSLEYRAINLNHTRTHKDILEILNILVLIKSKLTDSSFVDSEDIVIDNSLNLFSNKNRLHFTLHSPLTLGITDLEGRYTGLDPVTQEIVEDIPDVNYMQIGDTQFISLPYGVAYTLKLQGYDNGNFSLDIEKQNGNTVTDTNTFEDIHSLSTTLATVDIPSDFDVLNAKLKVDEDGDGVVDKTYPIPPHDDTNTNTNTPTSTNSSGGGSSGFPAPVVKKVDEPILNIEDKKEDIKMEVIEKLEIVKKEINKVAYKKIIPKVEREEVKETPEIENTQDLPLEASAINSGFITNWIWCGIILSILGIIFVFRRFIKF